MELVLLEDNRFFVTPEGMFWTPIFLTADYWLRMSEGFESVYVVARAEPVPLPQPGWRRADGENVTFVGLPNFAGVASYLRWRRTVGRIIKSVIESKRAVIIRGGSVLGRIAWDYLKKRPFGVRVGGDPWEALAWSSIRHVLSPWLRRVFAAQLRRECEEAAVVGYVTREILQRRYPAKPGRGRWFSDVALPDLAFQSAPKIARVEPPYTVLTIGSLEQLYKGVDVLIRAAARCLSGGLDLRLVVGGDGRYRAKLENVARREGIANRVEFLGLLPGREAVREWLDAVDLFVLASRAEGLPRVILEAMARGLPCLGTRVGGVPELLPESALVTPGAVDELATRMGEALRDVEWRQDAGRRNLHVARAFHEDMVAAARREFLEKLRNATAEWSREQ